MKIFSLNVSIIKYVFIIYFTEQRANRYNISVSFKKL